MKPLIANGSPTFCWYCNKQLRKAPGKGLGLKYFVLVTDQLGLDHRIHGQCAEATLADPGIKMKIGGTP